MRLHPGDTIGIASPCWLAARDHYEPIFEKLRQMGFRVRVPRNFYANGWGYAASVEQRAQDLNELIAADEVNMIFFGGGEGADELLPLLNYAAAARKPKIWMGFSDATSILNAIWRRSGLTVFYGQSPGDVMGDSAYNRAQFEAFLIEGNPRAHAPCAPWKTLTGGKARGTLAGGYLDNFVFVANQGWFNPPPDEDYILVVEDHRMFFGIEHISDSLGRLEQSPIMARARGLIFGHYSDPVNEWLLQRLKILGERLRIPVVYTDDFGHGVNHAIFPMGAKAALDADAQTLTY